MLRRRSASRILWVGGLKAVPGSLHGYDVVDPTRLAPLRSDRTLNRGVIATRSPPNGRGTSLTWSRITWGVTQSANPWWNDVLENSTSSRYARFPDIAWQPVKDELGQQGPHPNPWQSIRCRARTTGTHGRCVDEARLECATSTTGYQSRRTPTAISLEPDLDAWLSPHTAATSA